MIVHKAIWHVYFSATLQKISLGWAEAFYLFKILYGELSDVNISFWLNEQIKPENGELLLSLKVLEKTLSKQDSAIRLKNFLEAITSWMTSGKASQDNFDCTAYEFTFQLIELVMKRLQPVLNLYENTATSSGKISAIYQRAYAEKNRVLKDSLTTTE